jgi:hypothetical protein
MLYARMQSNATNALHAVQCENIEAYLLMLWW